ncbi:MAG: FtsB family cell division protein [Bacillota bacterium]
MSITGRKKKKPVSTFPSQYRESKYSTYKFVSSVGILIIVGLLIMLGAQHLQQRTIAKELAENEDSVTEYEQRKAELEMEIERLQETGYIETLARERLGLVKPDEIIIQLED